MQSWLHEESDFLKMQSLVEGNECSLKYVAIFAAIALRVGWRKTIYVSGNVWKLGICCQGKVNDMHNSCAKQYVRLNSVRRDTSLDIRNGGTPIHFRDLDAQLFQVVCRQCLVLHEFAGQYFRTQSVNGHKVKIYH